MAGFTSRNGMDLRGLAFRDGKKVLPQSRAGQRLHRYFPELVQALTQKRPERNERTLRQPSACCRENFVS
jgi:hypothetical protein